MKSSVLIIDVQSVLVICSVCVLYFSAAVI